MNSNPHAPLQIVGIGPGNGEYMTRQAWEALNACQCLVGYDLYLNLLDPYLKKNKHVVSSGMRHERERCEAAIEAACQGQNTALVCSGDPGIYALAGLVIELLEERGLLNRLPFDIIPGVPALCAAAARLGAPIGHDFACISLSDLLTPWERIEKRLLGAFEADFVCVLYNPRSRGRPDYLHNAICMGRRCRSGDCPVGLARNVGRPQETVEICTLDNFDCSQVDMLSIVIVGNSESRLAGSYFLTPRGYRIKKA